MHERSHTSVKHHPIRMMMGIFMWFVRGLRYNNSRCREEFFLKVEPYSIHGSFLKLEYLKTEFNEDSGTYASVAVTSHSCRIMENFSIRGYFEVMWHPKRTYLDVFRFLAKC